MLKTHEPALRRAIKGLPLPEKYIPPSRQKLSDAGGSLVSSFSSSPAKKFPRYARVNTLKMSLADARAALLSSPPRFNADDIVDDTHIPNLLLFPPGTDLHDHPLVKEGILILQDKASCFPAEVLLGRERGTGQGWWGDVIDACAAPGNKTSHAAALLQEIAPGRRRGKDEEDTGRGEKELFAGGDGGNGLGQDEAPGPRAPSSFLSSPSSPSSSSPSLVFAMDRDPGRLKILCERLRGMGALDGVVVPLLQDFLAVSSEDRCVPDSNLKKGEKLIRPGRKEKEKAKADEKRARFRNVRAILLDPSCSGSGMVKSIERRVEEEEGRKKKAQRSGRKMGKGEVEEGNEMEMRGGGEVEEELQSSKAVVKDGGSTQRLRALAQFQFKVLTQALTSFPLVNRVVYSTCSVHVEENEMVVAAALRAQMGGGRPMEAEMGLERIEEENKMNEGGAMMDKKENMSLPHTRLFELVPAMPSWPRRGLCRGSDGNETGLTEDEARCILRTDPKEDLTNGFFVAYFERQGTGGMGREVERKEGGGSDGKKKRKGEMCGNAMPDGCEIRKKRTREVASEDENGHVGLEMDNVKETPKQGRAAKRRERRKKKKKFEKELSQKTAAEGEKSETGERDRHDAEKAK